MNSSNITIWHGSKKGRFCKTSPEIATAQAINWQTQISGVNICQSCAMPFWPDFCYAAAKPPITAPLSVTGRAGSAQRLQK